MKKIQNLFIEEIMCLSVHVGIFFIYQHKFCGIFNIELERKKKPKGYENFCAESYLLTFNTERY